MRSPVFRHAGSWRHAGEGGGVPPKSHPGGGAGLSHSQWCCIVLCVNVVQCDDGLPPPPGWHHGVPIGGPRMSPTPRSAKYGVTHGCNPSRGSENACLWSSAPRVGRGVRCLHRGADAALRPDWRRRDGGDRANRANRANRLRCVSSAWSMVVALLRQRLEHPEVGATDHNPVQRQLCRDRHLPSRVRAEGTLL